MGLGAPFVQSERQQCAVISPYDAPGVAGQPGTANAASAGSLTSRLRSPPCSVAAHLPSPHADSDGRRPASWTPSRTRLEARRGSAKKARPTPRRREAERRARSGSSRRGTGKQLARGTRAKRQGGPAPRHAQALMTGDQSTCRRGTGPGPAPSPATSSTRRRCVAEFFLPALLVVLLLSLLRNIASQTVVHVPVARHARADRRWTRVLVARRLSKRGCAPVPRRRPQGPGAVRADAQHAAAPAAAADAAGQARRGRQDLSRPCRPGDRRRARARTASRRSVGVMEFRHLGRSGLKVSEIAYGNWLTHGSQVEEDAALACVRAALDDGITTFDTADVYANTEAEAVLGRALAGERREAWRSSPRCTGRPVPGPNDRGLSRKHIMESIDGSLRRLGTDYVDLYQAHRYDHETPLEETMQAFADVVRAGQGPLHRGVGVAGRRDPRRPRELAARAAASRSSRTSRSTPCCGGSSRPRWCPTCQRARASAQIVWSPIAQGVLTGKYKPGEQPPAGSRATDDKGGAVIVRGSSATSARPGAAARAARRGGRAEPGPAGGRVGAAEPQRRRPRSSAPPGRSR